MLSRHILQIQNLIILNLFGIAVFIGVLLLVRHIFFKNSFSKKGSTASDDQTMTDNIELQQCIAKLPYEKRTLLKQLETLLNDRINTANNPEPYVLAYQALASIVDECQFINQHQYRMVEDETNKRLQQLTESIHQIDNRQRKDELELLKNQTKETLKD